MFVCLVHELPCDVVCAVLRFLVCLFVCVCALNWVCVFCVLFVEYGAVPYGTFVVVCACLCSCVLVCLMWLCACL